VIGVMWLPSSRQGFGYSGNHGSRDMEISLHEYQASINWATLHIASFAGCMPNLPLISASRPTITIFGGKSPSDCLN
jgi:hypothetical protein